MDEMFLSDRYSCRSKIPAGKTSLMIFMVLRVLVHRDDHVGA